MSKRLVVIGTGYVGLVTGACFAEMGNHVTCVDKDAEKVTRLQAGHIPIYEPGLEAIVRGNSQARRLEFTCDLAAALIDAEMVFIAVGTPQADSGAADLRYVEACARELGQLLAHDVIVVGKSTIPVGTNERIMQWIDTELKVRGVTLNLGICSNPEFLKEGSAVDDFMKPDRIIVGTEQAFVKEAMMELYAPFNRNHQRVMFMGLRDAELTKYAANAMLATKISFMNEIANICERLNVDVEHVRQGIGADQRIGYHFIYPGCGYGGSCFPKDVSALIHIAQTEGFEANLLQAVEQRNELQKQRLFEKISARFRGDLQGRKFAVWGLAFKPGTDDMRCASAVVLIRALIEAEATVAAYDPVAMDAAKREFAPEWFSSQRLQFVSNQYEALQDADALALVTEWKPFRNPDFHAMKRMMKSPIIYDGRNQYEPAIMKKEAFEYYGIGRL